MPAIDSLLLAMVECEGCDLHLTSADPPAVRTPAGLGALADAPAPGPGEVAAWLQEIAPPAVWDRVLSGGAASFAYELGGVGLFRVRMFLDLAGPGAAIRRLPLSPQDAESLGLPADVLRFGDHRAGLVLFAGDAGSGRSSSAAALVEHINASQERRMIVIQECLESVFVSRRSVVSQREVGRSGDGGGVGFTAGLRAAMREDADVLYVDDLSETDCIEAALDAAELGRLVIGCLPAPTATAAIDRLLGKVPGNSADYLLGLIARNLRGVVAQALCPRADGQGRVAAFEVMVGTKGMASLIARGRTSQIQNAINVGHAHGMVTLNSSLRELVRQELITGEVERRHQVDEDVVAMGDQKGSFVAENRAAEMAAQIERTSPVATVGSRPPRQVPSAAAASENLQAVGTPAPVEPGTQTGSRFQAAVAAKKALADKKGHQGSEDFEAFRARLANKA